MEKKLITLLLLLQLLSLNCLSLKDSSSEPNANITVMGLVYCDVCSNNSFSKHSYFIPGVEVRIVCTFNSASSRTREMINFSANRTTNEHGLYKLDITSLEGVTCASEAEKDSLMASCQASLISSSLDSCNVPGFRTTTDQIVFKSEKSNVCIYGFTALNFRVQTLTEKSSLVWQVIERTNCNKLVFVCFYSYVIKTRTRWLFCLLLILCIFNFRLCSYSLFYF